MFYFVHSSMDILWWRVCFKYISFIGVHDLQAHPFRFYFDNVVFIPCISRMKWKVYPNCKWSLTCDHFSFFFSRKIRLHQSRFGVYNHVLSIGINSLFLVWAEARSTCLLSRRNEPDWNTRQFFFSRMKVPVVPILLSIQPVVAINSADGNTGLNHFSFYCLQAPKAIWLHLIFPDWN